MGLDIWLHTKECFKNLDANSYSGLRVNTIVHLSYINLHFGLSAPHSCNLTLLVLTSVYENSYGQVLPNLSLLILSQNPIVKSFLIWTRNLSCLYWSWLLRLGTVCGALSLPILRRNWVLRYCVINIDFLMNKIVLGHVGFNDIPI